MKDVIKSKLNDIIKILFIITTFLFAMPSIVYLIQNKTVFEFGPYFQFLYGNSLSRIQETLIYIIVLAILAILYFVII